MLIMTLDEAIEHTKNVGYKMTRQCGNKQRSCGLEYIQLSIWLEQLKQIEDIIDADLSNEIKIKNIKAILDKKGILI